MAVAFVQSKTVQSSGATSLTTASFVSTAGNFLVAGIGQIGTNLSGSPVTDSTSGSWQNALVTNGGTTKNGIYYLENITGSATQTVTYTRLGGSGVCALIVIEFSSVALSSSIDKTASTNSASLVKDSGNTATTTQAAELLIGIGGVNTNTSLPATVPSLFIDQIKLADSGPEGLLSSYSIVSATGAYTFLSDYGSAGSAERIGIATFKGTGITFVQSGSATSSGATSLTTAGITTTSGNFISAFGTSFTRTFSTTVGTQVADSKGNTFLGAWAGAQAGQFYAENITGGASHTFTLTPPGGSSACSFGVMEFSGVDTSSSIDKTASASSTTAPRSSGATTTTSQASELLLGGSAQSHLTTFAYSSSTGGIWHDVALADSSPEGLIVAWQVVSVTGAYNYKFTEGSTLVNAGVGIATFKALITDLSASLAQESLKISESLTLILNPLATSISDSLKIQDTVTTAILENEEVLQIESVKISDSVLQILNPEETSQSESLKISDTVSTTLSPLEVIQTESLKTAEDLAAALVGQGVNQTESLKISDTLSALIEAALEVSKIESLKITDSIARTLNPEETSKTESLKISDSVIVALDVREAAQSESIHITDSILVSLTSDSVSKTEILYLTDELTAAIVDQLAYYMETLRYSFVDLDDTTRKEGRATNFGDIHVGMSDSQGNITAGTASLTISDLGDRPIATRQGTAGQGYFDGDQIEIFALSDKGRRTSATPNRLARVLLDEDSYEGQAEAKFSGTDPFFATNTSLLSTDSKFPFVPFPRYYVNAPEDVFSKYMQVILGEVSDAGAKDPNTGRLTPRGKCKATYLGMDGLPTGPGGSAEQWGRFNASLYAIYRITGLFGSDLGGGLYGSASATSNGATPSVITLRGAPSLVNVAVDGSVTITLFTAKGRTVAKIKGISGSTVTTDSTIEAVDAVNVDWIIGENTPDRKEIDITTRNGIDVMVPGYPNYVRSTTYEDLLFEGETIRVTDFWVRGPLLDEHLSGTVSITFNAIGIEDRGDGTGLPITDYFMAEYWWWLNCGIVHTRMPGGIGFVGLWPQTDGDVAALGGAFADGTYKINGQSFVDAQDWSTTITPGGFKISACISEPTGMRDMAQMWNLNAGGPIVRTGVNEHGQIFKWFLDIYADPSDWPSINMADRVFGKTKRWNAKREIENVTKGTCDWDPDEGKFRRGITEIKSTTGILHSKGVRKESALIECKFVADVDQLTAMLTARNNFTKDGPNYVSILGGDAGLWDYKIGSGFKYTDSVLALIDEPLFIIDKVFHLSSMTVDLLCIDVGTGPVVNGSNSGVSVLVPSGQQFLITDDTATASVVTDDSSLAPMVSV